MAHLKNETKHLSSPTNHAYCSELIRTNRINGLSYSLSDLIAVLNKLNNSGSNSRPRIVMETVKPPL